MSTQPELFETGRVACRCGRHFVPRRRWQKHCSDKCRIEASLVRRAARIAPDAACTHFSTYEPASLESMAAAASVDAGTAERHRRAILALLAQEPLIYEELHARSGIPENSLRARMRDLRLAGRVARSDVRRQTRYGKTARCWELKGSGE